MSPRTRQRPGLGSPDAAKTTAAVDTDDTPAGMAVEAEVVAILDAASAQALVERIDVQNARMNYPRALARLDDDDRKTISKEFPHVT